MSRYIEVLRANLREILQEEPQGFDDFVSLALAGEALRRALAAEVELESEDAVEALRAYDEGLLRWGHLAPMGLEAALQQACAALDAYAAEPWTNRDPQQGADAVDAIEQVLSVAAASCRAGVLASEEVDRLARLAADLTGSLVGRLSDLWQWLWDRELSEGADPKHGGLMSFRAALADPAPSKQAIAQAVVHEVRRRQRIEELVRDFAASPSSADLLASGRSPSRGQPQRSISPASPEEPNLAGRLRSWAARTPRILLGSDRLVGAPAYATGRRMPPEVRVICEVPDLLRVATAERHLLLSLQRDARLEVRSIATESGRTLEIDRIGPGSVRVSLAELAETRGEAADTTIRARLLIDGEEVELPPMVWER